MYWKTKYQLFIKCHTNINFHIIRNIKILWSYWMLQTYQYHGKNHSTNKCTAEISSV